MLIVVRKPVIDLRSFANDEAERAALRLPPSWDVGEFVRGIGPIVRRHRETGVAWPNERTFVDFSSTLRFNPQDLGRLGRSLHPIRVRRITRRMWSQLSTEPALLNLDVALPLDGPSWAIESAGRWLPRAIQDLLDVETRVPSGSRSPLSRGLRDVLDRYGRETRMDSGRESYLLRSGSLFVAVEAFGPLPPASHPKDTYVAVNLGVAITNLRVKLHGGGAVDASVITGSSDSPETRRAVRELRINLLALRSVADFFRTITMLSWGRASSSFAAPGSDEYARFEHCLISAVSVVERSRMSNSIMNRDLASVALSAREMLTNRDLEVLQRRVLGSHPAVHERLTALTRMEADRALADSVLNSLAAGSAHALSIGSVTVESKYNIQAHQVGAVGDNASAGNLTHSTQQLVIGQSSFDAFDLVADLKRLARALAISDAHDEDAVGDTVAALTSAEAAARSGDAQGVGVALAKTGTWVLRVAEGIGVPVAIAAIKAAIGLP